MPNAKKRYSNLHWYRQSKETVTDSQGDKVGVPLGDKNVLLKGEDLLATFRRLHECCNTNPDCLTLLEIEEKRAGHVRSLKVKCSVCNLDEYVDRREDRSATSFREGTVTNRSFAFVADCVGVDFHQLKMLCGILNLPGPPDSYDSVHQEVIYQGLLKQVDSQLEANRKYSFENALYKRDGKAIIAVKTDGTYQKRGDCRRGYTSKIGVVLLTDAYTGKFLDFRVLTKYCHVCTQQQKWRSTDDFATWRENHIAAGECSNNFDGPSTEMERAAVKDMFEKSLVHNLMYLYLVGDGDSKSFLDVWKVYGVCQHCQSVQHLLLNRSGKDYEKWTSTEDFRR